MPVDPSTRKGAATRRRILDAAAEEFAARGIAGARIDRITSAARTNKAQLYGYFGSKDALFDAVVGESVAQITSAVPFDATDLADWAVRLYDYYLARPDLDRLATWIRLERRPTGALFERAEHREKLDAIAAAQASGLVRAGDPLDILAIAIALSRTWAPSSSTFTASEADPDTDHERRRRLLRASAARALAPESSD
jgi:AcrR family transcriptional regulator